MKSLDEENRQCPTNCQLNCLLANKLSIKKTFQAQFYRTIENSSFYIHIHRTYCSPFHLIHHNSRLSHRKPTILVHTGRCRNGPDSYHIECHCSSLHHFHQRNLVHHHSAINLQYTLRQCKTLDLWRML